MTTKQQLEALIADLEAADGPSRSLDRRIRVVAESLGIQISRAMLRYTASIDAALRLVPEGWEWKVSNRAVEPDAGRAYIHTRELQHIGVSGMTPNPAYKGFENTAATPALALCIAALRARLADD